MPKLWPFLIFVGLIFATNCYSKDVYHGKSDQELLDVYLEDPKVGHNPLDVKYIYTELYIGMEEQEFLALYERKESIKTSDLRPIIKEYKKDQYYLKSVNNVNYRISFKGGKLANFEVLKREKPPFVFLVYSNYSYMLKGYEFAEGLYRWMPEEEFLRKKQFQIIEKVRENYYYVKSKDGFYYTVSFLNGNLDGVYKQGLERAEVLG